MPLFIWWLCLLGAVTCFYGLSHSTEPSFRPRITVIGKASDCVEERVGRSFKFAFRFVPEGGSPTRIETRIIMPHWGSAQKFNAQTLRIVYLNAPARDTSNEVIDIEILNRDSAGWHDSLDARPFGIWLGIPIGAALASLGLFGIRYRTDDRKSVGASERASLASGV